MVSLGSFLRRLAAALAVAMPLTAGADDHPARWPQFHGPGGAGVAEGEDSSPVDFGPEKSLLWKTGLPAGHSSPVLWGERIFLTGFHPEEKRLETLCLDRANGRILWRRSVPTGSIEPVHKISSPAVSTPVTDGKAVFVYFGSYGLVAYDLEGRELWSKPLPMVQTFRQQGSGTSPIVAGDRLLLDVHLGEASYLLAVRTATGEYGLGKPPSLSSTAAGIRPSSGRRETTSWSVSSTPVGLPLMVSATGASGGGSTTFPGRPAPPRWSATESSS